MTTEEDQESGSTLRAKLEAAIASNKALADRLASATVSTFKYVKAEDLSGVEPDQYAAKAQEIEEARKTQAEELAKQFLAEKFGPDVDLDSVLAGKAEESAGDEGAADRLASLGQLGGTPPGQSKGYNPLTDDPMAILAAGD